MSVVLTNPVVEQVGADGLTASERAQNARAAADVEIGRAGAGVAAGALLAVIVGSPRLVIPFGLAGAVLGVAYHRAYPPPPEHLPHPPSLADVIAPSTP